MHMWVAKLFLSAKFKFCKVLHKTLDVNQSNGIKIKLVSLVFNRQKGEKEMKNVIKNIC